MADRVTAVALIDGKEVEVTLKDLPAGYVAESALDERFKEKLNKRVASVTKSMREELMDDDDYVQSILEKRGIDPKAKPGDKNGGGEFTGDPLAKAQKEWADKNFTPVQQEPREAEGRQREAPDLEAAQGHPGGRHSSWREAGFFEGAARAERSHDRPSGG